MSVPSQPRLNHFTVLRYDVPHHTDLSVGVLPDETDPAHPDGSEHMDVNGINSVGRAYPVGSSKPAAEVSKTEAASALPAPRDQVEISSEGRTLENLSRTSDLREGRLAQIRAAIADGSYDTSEKLDIALSRLLRQHGLDESA